MIEREKMLAALNALMDVARNVPGVTHIRFAPEISAIYNLIRTACPLLDLPEKDAYPDTMEYADACMTIVERLKEEKE
jgi:hypothetical protein